MVRQVNTFIFLYHHANVEADEGFYLFYNANVARLNLADVCCKFISYPKAYLLEYVTF